MATKLRFATDADILGFESTFEKHRPKENGSWDRWHQQAMDEIEARLRLHRATPDQLELGRVGLRSRENLRRVAAWFAIHFAYLDADWQNPNASFFKRKADYYFQRAVDTLEAEAIALDYDVNNDGDVDASEYQRPFPTRIIRG